MKLSEKRKEFIKLVKEHYGPLKLDITRQEILNIQQIYIVNYPTWLVNNPSYKLSRGVYKLPNMNISDIVPDDVETEVSIPIKKEIKKIVFTKPNNTIPQEGMIPCIDETFVPFGAYWDVKSIIESEIFFPIYLSGPTRSGKTLIPLQICGELKKNLYRVNITIETDESDLLGGYKLINGNTVWEDGPAIKAAEDPTGAILLLDEIDLGSNKLLCLQPLLEGSGIYIKKINRWVRPCQGFNIIATANTKGRGSDDGKYIGTNILNEAMLERFPITYDQGYAEKKVEALILKKNLKLFGIESPDFIEKLCQWAQIIRKTKDDGGIDETISTGRLVYIVKTYVIFGQNRMKAIKDNIARFDLNTQTSFLDAYTKIDENAVDGPDNEQKENTNVPVTKVKKVW